MTNPYRIITWLLVNFCLVSFLSAQAPDTTGNWGIFLQAKNKADSLQHEEVLELLNKIEPSYFASGDHHRMAEIYLKKAYSHLSLTQIQLAGEYLSKARPIIRQDQPEYKELWSNWLFQKGVFFQESARYDSAEIYFALAKPLYRELWGDQSAEIGELYYFLAVNMVRIGSNQQGLNTLEEALERFRKTEGDSSAWVGKTLNVIGYTYGEMGDHQNQIDYYQQSLAINRKVWGDDHPEVAVNYNNLSYTMSIKGDFHGSVEYLRKALAINEKNPEKTQMVLSGNYLNLGMNYAYIGDYRRGKHFMDKALEMRLRIYGNDHPAIANVYHNLGTVSMDLRKFDDAINFFSQALHIRRRLLGETHPYVPLTHSLLGSGILESGDPQTAFGHFEKGLKGLKATLGEGHFMVAHVYFEYAYCLDKLERREEAQAAYQKAIEIMSNTIGSDNALLARVYESYASSLIESGKTDQGIQVLQEGLIILCHGFNEQDVMKNPVLSQVSFDIVSVFLTGAKGIALLESNRTHDLKRLKAAWETLLLTDSLIQRMRLGTWSGNNEDLFSWRFIEVYEKAVATAQRIYDQTGEESRLKKAFSLAEKAKAITLYQAVQKNQAMVTAGIPAALLKKERFLQSEIGYYNKMIFAQQSLGDQADSVKLLDAMQQFFSLTRERNDLLDLFGKNYPKYYQLKFDHGEVDIDKIQRNLNLDEAMISYFVGLENLYAFLITNDGFLLHQIPLSDQWQEDFQTFIQQLKDTRIADQQAYSPTYYLRFTQNAHRYYQDLIAPFRDQLDQKTKLVIIPHRMLGYLPFDVLMEHPANAEIDYVSLPYLLKKWQVRYTYSAALFANPTVIPRKRRSLYAGFAPGGENPEELIALGLSGSRDSPEGFGELSANQPEVKITAELMNGNSWLAANATETNFRHNTENFKILHLATHAWLNDEDPLYSGLLFTSEITGDSAVLDSLFLANEGKDGFLHAYEIYNLPIRADLAVLSACETGAGKLKGSEGIISLARAFRYAGCPNIIMSLWKAEDIATRDLMVLFYRNLKEGMGKDQALQQAKLEFLQTSDKQSPHFWANFVLIGDSLPITPDKRPWPLVILGAVLVLVFAGWGIRKILFNRAEKDYSSI